MPMTPETKEFYDYRNKIYEMIGEFPVPGILGARFTTVQISKARKELIKLGLWKTKRANFSLDKERERV